MIVAKPHIGFLPPDPAARGWPAHTKRLVLEWLCRIRLLLLALSILYSLTSGAQSVATPKTDCQTLMNAALPIAKDMLQRHGEFFPYGVALTAKGDVVNVATYDGRERPPSKDVIQFLKQIFVQGAKSGEYKATALVYDVRVILPTSGQKSDAIAVSLNHREQYSILVFIPYQMKNGQVSFGEVFAQQGEADVFPAN